MQNKTFTVKDVGEGQERKKRGCRAFLVLFASLFQKRNRTERDKQILRVL